ncbi:MAG: peptidase M23, partial [Desulfuromonadales bacterium]|nr:peptidase M23 [Desulfuromonadales bacterium]NIR32962.1 peptidase M23 [Desulfuromonadales bacterium]NIS40520.1 peptidase M23 [Desulfuromonadales bacterium]
MDYDFSPPRRLKRPKKRIIKIRHLIFIAILAVVSTIFLLEDSSPIPETEAHVGPAELSTPPPEPPPLVKEVRRGQVSHGDTITSLLGGFFSPQEIYNLSRESRDVFPLTRICAGQPYRLCTEDGTFESF